MPAARAELEHAIRRHVRTLGTKMADVHRLLAARLRINETQLRAIDRLNRHGAQTAGDLSRALNLSTGATTTMVDGLIERGHAKRLVDPSDRRRAVISATASTAAREALAPFSTSLQARLEGYDLAGLALLEQFLAGLTEDVHAHVDRLAAADRSDS